MVQVNLKYVHEFKDRHGKVRHYFRRNGKQTPLRGTPGSPEFMEDYRAAFHGEAPNPRPSKGMAGSIEVAVRDFLASTMFASYAEATRKLIRSELTRFAANHGDKPVNRLEWKHIDQILAPIQDKPAACHHLIASLRCLMTYCIKTGLRKDDPTRGIKLPPMSKEGYRTWSEDDIANFEAKFPAGTMERRAEKIALNTALRREDLVILGWQHVQGNFIRIRPKKTERSTGIVLDIPITDDLKAVLNEVPPDQPTFLLNRVGGTFTPNNFSQFFGTACSKAKLPAGSGIHGLRKAACRRLAEAGCTTHQIMAISGHTSLREVERYTKAAGQKRMAQSAIAIVSNAFAPAMAAE